MNPDPPKLNLSKPFCLRADLGKEIYRNVRILAADLAGAWPICYAVKYGEITDKVILVNDCGIAIGFCGSGFDLVNIPAKRIKVEGWINVHKGYDQATPTGLTLLNDHKLAMSFADGNTFARAHVIFEVEEGEGLCGGGHKP